MSEIIITQAEPSEHKDILAIAKQHRCTKDFGSHMFSPPSAYEKGWIRAAVDWCTHGKPIIGFVCVRHKVRDPETSLYFMGVHEDHKRKGVAQALLEDIKTRCPNPRIVLNVDKQNQPALDFWKAQGFVVTGDALKGKGVAMKLEW